MIQIETNTSETGQALSQASRNNLAEKNSEESIDFSQVWSEFIEADAPKVVPPVSTQAPIVQQSDAASLEESLAPDVEEMDVQPKLQSVETRLADRETMQVAQSTGDGHPTPQARTPGDPREPLLPEASLVHGDGLTQATDRPDVIQASEVGMRYVAPPARPESSTPILPVAQAGFPAAPLRTSEGATAEAAVPLEPNSAPTPTAPVTGHRQRASGDGVTSEPIQRQVRPDPASFPNATRGQQSEARLPTEGTPKQAALASRPSATPSALTTVPIAKPADRVQVPTPMQASIQTPDQTQKLPNHITPVLRERAQAPQPVAKSNPLASSNKPTLTPPLLSNEGLSVPVPNSALETEPTMSQLLPVNSASVSTATTSASQQNAPQVTSQIAAAISLSPNRTTEILLNPQELGRVRISLTNGDAGMTVNILTERHETTELMRRNIELLARDLRDMGYENPSFTFGERSDGSHDAWSDEHPESEHEIPNNTTEPQTSSMHVTLTGGLDLKL